MSNKKNRKLFISFECQVSKIIYGDSSVNTVR